MGQFTYALTWIVRLADAVVVSFFLFTGVALLHAAFGFGTKTAAQQARRITAMDIIRKPPPEEKKTVQQHMRQVQHSNEGKSGDNRMAMRFTPDLTVDASASGGGGAVVQKQDVKAEVFEQGQVDQDAVPQYMPPIPYPERARDQNIQGEVEIVFVVSYQGKVTDIEITRSPSQIFSSEVRRAAASWRFKPAKNKGIPVNQRFRKVIEFKQN
jgi:TonB family protein